jgi:hypothetical protein
LTHLFSEIKLHFISEQSLTLFLFWRGLIGEEWITGQRTPILKVPSAIIPVEFNYIFNPEHPDLKFEFDLEMDFKFDRRMWKYSN